MTRPTSTTIGRLVMRPRHRSALLPAMLVGVGVSLTGCGSSGLLPAEDATRLQDALTEAEQAYDTGRCQDAAAAVADGRERISGLPGSTDTELVRSLERGFRNLRSRISSTCEATPTTTEEAPTTTQEEVPTTEVAPPPTTEEAPPSTEEAPPPTQEAPPTTPDDGGGSSGSGSGTDQGPSGGGPDVPDAVDGAGRTARGQLREAARELRRQARGGG